MNAAVNDGGVARGAATATMADHSQQSQEIPSQIDLTSYLADVGIFSECLTGASGRDVALWASEHVGAAFGWARSVEQTSSMIMQEDDAEVDEELRRQHAASATRGPGGALTIGQLRAAKQLLLSRLLHNPAVPPRLHARTLLDAPAHLGVGGVGASPASSQGGGSQGGGSQRERAIGAAPRGPLHALLQPAVRRHGELQLVRRSEVHQLR